MTPFENSDLCTLKVRRNQLSASRRRRGAIIYSPLLALESPLRSPVDINVGKENSDDLQVLQ
jgi:hypothetical protein